ncbi:hypothetical protein SYNTR_1678 [Candidatus Syntrophocurvum alkaliphilum]|uniref:Uncharacterized protein n=1 Tax=Candidatus Syntrophocurvum alkaliphilum TaxID=2293317 RepID=A0A6I6DDR5_9FIRM|nr:hypothetical protein [Candidatus Syntrophocurvum alkaliphilum]QGU00272.1 hypothetical protein SYNTR_1678 [Candidatus Syntrophocurvum alkaliphilum]
MNMLQKERKSGERKTKKMTTSSIAGRLPVRCPRNVGEIYALGISFQYCTGDIYLELAPLKQKPESNLYKKLGFNQLDTKNEIQKLSDNYLNNVLRKYYENGGKIIEDTISKEQAKQIQPYYTNILLEFLQEVDELKQQALNGALSFSETKNQINNSSVRAYEALADLYPSVEMKRAFEDLMGVVRR